MEGQPSDKYATPYSQVCPSDLSVYWNSLIAPKDIIISDLEKTIRGDDIMYANKKTGNILSIKAIEGHAQSGHGYFKGHPYPNTTTIDVLDAIEEKGCNLIYEGFSKADFQKTTQKQIDSIVSVMENWFKHIEANISNPNAMSRYVTIPSLNGMSCYNNIKLDALELARGFYLAANMDTLEGIRSVGFEKYGHKTGGGECYLANMEKLKKSGIRIRDLAKIQYMGIFNPLNTSSHQTRLRVLRDLKIIEGKNLPLEDIAQGEYTWKKIKNHLATTNLIENPNYQGVYIREKKGRGVGDDIVIRLAEYLPESIFEKNRRKSKTAELSKMFGALWADAIDTEEKHSKYFMPGGQDYIAGFHINGLYKKLAQDPRFRERFKIKERPDENYNLVPHNELVDFTIAGANTKKEHIHSSQRWFYKNIKGTCAVAEIIKHMCDSTPYRIRQRILRKLKNFNLNFNNTPKKAKFTFDQVPLQEIHKIFNNRIKLVKDPSKREENIRRFYENL